MIDYQNDDEDDDYISKSHFKREAEAAQDLGERLITLRKEQLDQLDLSEKLYDAILLAQRLTANGAIRRQRQFIGKLMRTEILEPIEAKLAEWDRGGKAETARLHRLERWRDRLINDENMLGEWLKEYPETDVQHFRSLIRNAHKEKEQNKPPKSSRELFKLLREITADESLR
ncbi:ribosome-associated protein [Thiothrix caldifontis]|uniref:Dual-action ribosomal maturation protein DarP n=1 Tax=Thiothrix caldifontis TaxID=525918 RepID=A0A1H4BR50_9GAMM|nr:ribosome biogenesis factor YjgA [Thiothrix caldifontis]SEA50579.1 ribosome-associated protein [Thiothrix caldifontis]